MPGGKENTAQITDFLLPKSKTIKTGLWKIPEMTMEIIKSPYAVQLIINGLAQHELKHN